MVETVEVVVAAVAAVVVVAVEVGAVGVAVWVAVVGAEEEVVGEVGPPSRYTGQMKILSVNYTVKHLRIEDHWKMKVVVVEM